jgi:hypothetical protein
MRVSLRTTIRDEGFGYKRAHKSSSTAESLGTTRRRRVAADDGSGCDGL